MKKLEFIPARRRGKVGAGGDVSEEEDEVGRIQRDMRLIMRAGSYNRGLEVGKTCW